MRKRIAAMMLALALCLGLAGTALAAESPEGIPTREEAESMFGIFTDMEGNVSDFLVKERVTVRGTDVMGNEDVEIKDSSYWRTTSEATFYIRNRSGRDDCVVRATQRLFENDGTGVYREVKGWSGTSLDQNGQLVEIPDGVSLTINKDHDPGYFGGRDVYLCITPQVMFRTSENSSKAYIYGTYFFKIGAADPTDPTAIQEPSDESAGSTTVTTLPGGGGFTIRFNPTAVPTSAPILVNGEKTAFDAYEINGNNYFKLRDLAYVLNGTDKQFEIAWDGAANAISLTSGAAYTAVGGEMTAKGAGKQNAVRTTAKILLDGEEVSFTAYEINGNNYFKLRDVGEAFDFGVDWDDAAQTIRIDTSKGYTVG